MVAARRMAELTAPHRRQRPHRRSNPPTKSTAAGLRVLPYSRRGVLLKSGFSGQLVKRWHDS